MKHSDFPTTQRDIDDAKVMTEKPNVFVPDVIQSISGRHSKTR
jgi:hypothetical protein